MSELAHPPTDDRVARVGSANGDRRSFWSLWRRTADDLAGLASPLL